MATHLDADKVRAANVQAMGASLGALYSDLVDEVIWLHATWRQYRVLFGTSEERVELINHTAGFFFGVLQDTLWHSILLQISRLTDPPRPGRRGRETLTLRRLPNALGAPELRLRVSALLRHSTNLSEFARDWRDRRIAHRDLALVQSENARPLADASRADVERVLASFREIINAIGAHYFGSDMNFDHVSPANDAEALLYQLAFTRMIQDERTARAAAGEHRPEDWTRPPKI